MNTFEDNRRALNNVHTVVAHGYVCNNLLENRPSFLKFLVLCFRGLKLGAKFLGRKAVVWWSWCIINVMYLDLSALKELCILSRLSGHAGPNR